MGSSIYTGTGDGGTTSLVDGVRVDKDAPRVEAYGTVDEANSWVGLARASSNDRLLDGVLEFLGRADFQIKLLGVTLAAEYVAHVT